MVRGGKQRRLAAGVVDDDRSQEGWMTRDSQSAHCPAHPTDYTIVEAHGEEKGGHGVPSDPSCIMLALPYATELRLRRTTPFTKITCSITSVLCKHDSPSPLA